MGMHLRFKIILVVLLLIIVACSKQQYVCPNGSTVDNVADCPKPEVKVEAEEQVKEEVKEVVQETTVNIPLAPEPEVEEAVTNIDDKSQELIDKVEKVKSFSFVYVGPPENLPKDTYYVKGNLMKVELLKATDHKLTQDFTSVYIDTDSNSAVGYCEAREISRCPEGVKVYPGLDPDDYTVKTPYQWLKSIVTGEYLGNGPQFEKKATSKIKFTTNDGVSGEMYVIDFHALPGRVVLDDGSKYEFRDLSVNSVKDADVTFP